MRYLLAYLATGAAATLFYTLLVARLATLPLVGASGAISGVLGFYFLWFPLQRRAGAGVSLPLLMRVFEIPARIVLGVYLVCDNIVPLIFTAGQGGGGVAHGAHIGGFLAGLAGAWLIDRVTTTAKPADYASSAPEVMPAPVPSRQPSIAATWKQPRGPTSRPPNRTRCPGPNAGARRLAGDAWARRRRARRLSPVDPRSWQGTGSGRGTTRRGSRRTRAGDNWLRPISTCVRPSSAILRRRTRARAMEALREIADQQKYPMRRFSGRTI